MPKPPTASASVLRIGTRRSPLALWQAEWLCARVRERCADVEPLLVPMQTSGDRVQGPLHLHGGKGLFVKELDAALLAGTIDCAIHSLKDVPGILAEGVALGAISTRESPWDLLVLREPWPLAALPRGARIGTSSPRRRWQLSAWRPDLQVVELRGNVGTRLQHVTDGTLDGTVLAEAGVRRLGLVPAHAVRLPLEIMIPAIGQGVLAVTVRPDDAAATTTVRQACHDPREAVLVAAERALLAEIEGDCHTPLAGLATWDGDAIRLQAFLAMADGQRMCRETEVGSAAQAAALGTALARRLRTAIGNAG
ncbi:MAG: hydroxymethylbilane synthase [Deltaproteobacteria bacterium]|nr:hydroxymethylbilane synthase [Deltaproteobacteria bacterium]